MSIVELLKKEAIWTEFLQHKIDGGHLSKLEQEKLEKYIANKDYEPVVESIINKQDFPLPTIKCINKKILQKRERFLYTKKKRIMF